MPFAFVLDPTNLLLGLLLGAAPLAVLAWNLQRAQAGQAAERLLLEERLSQARLAQEGLSVQIDGLQDDLRAQQQESSQQQAELAALRRERELLGRERETAQRELEAAEQAWSALYDVA